MFNQFQLSMLPLFYHLIRATMSAGDTGRMVMQLVKDQSLCMDVCAPLQRVQRMPLMVLRCAALWTWKSPHPYWLLMVPTYKILVLQSTHQASLLKSPLTKYQSSNPRKHWTPTKTQDKCLWKVCFRRYTLHIHNPPYCLVSRERIRHCIFIIFKYNKSCWVLLILQRPCSQNAIFKHNNGTSHLCPLCRSNTRRTCLTQTSAHVTQELTY